MPLNRDNETLETNALWGTLTAEVLVLLGVRDVVISPGSRSTPLTLGLAENPRLECRVVLDERSAAYFALGLAQSRGRPVLLVCTSGTAGANYLPAVVEAAEANLPLIILTADRPPERRFRQAGQTIDQVKMFGGFVRFFAEAPVPSGRLEVLQAWRDLLASAFARSRGSNAGPVHINCPFREPLGPLEPGKINLAEAVAPLIAEWAEAVPVEPARAVLPDLPERGWVIAGAARPQDPEVYVRAVGNIAEQLGWPIVADVLNPCRHFSDLLATPVLSAYDCVFRSSEIAREWRPDAVLQLGPLPTSKVLRRCLSQWQVPTWVVEVGTTPINAAAAPAHTIPVAVENLRLDTTLTGGRDHLWWQELAALDARARDAIEDALEENDHTEPAIAATVFQALPAETPLFIASSMPVRDAEYFWRPDGEHRRLFFNRGANGIDGTLSTALGVAEGMGRPSVLYTGDLALLHDTNGMLIARTAFTGSLTVVCLNNGGGGIFHHLPIAAAGGLFEDYFATPQSVDFRLLAAAYGVEHSLANNVRELSDWLQNLPAHGVRVIEVRSERAIDAAFRQDLFREIAATL